MTNLEIFTKKPEGVRIISNSEVADWTLCENKHRYAFGMNLEPKTTNRSLTIGIILHEILAEYYRALKAGKSKTEAYQAGVKLLTTHFAGASDWEPLSIVQVLFSRYVEQDTLADGSEILAVEEDYYLPINDEIWYAMRLDLLVRSIRGRSAGDIFLIDHKSTYDFYSADDLKLNAQMPKYIGVLRFNGVPVEDGYLNQFRTRFGADLINRKSDEDLFRRDPVGITPVRIQNAFRQQIIASERIIQRRSLPPDLQKQEALPILNKMVCRSCSFKMPCQMEQDGIPVAQYLKDKFQPRTYGYNELEA